MTNADSRKNISGQVSRLTIYIGRVSPTALPKVDGYKPLGVWQFYLALEEAVCKWIESFNVDRGKFEHFIARYDRVITDARYLSFDVPPNVVDDLCHNT